MKKAKAAAKKAGKKVTVQKEKIMPYSKYSPKQKRLAAVAKPRKKITAADFKKLKSKKKK